MSAPALGTGPYTVQTWQGETRVHDDISDLSLDAAREIARAHMALDYVGRVWSDRYDYVEVYDPKRGVRSGTFAETTLVTFVGEES